MTYIPVEIIITEVDPIVIEVQPEAVSQTAANLAIEAKTAIQAMLVTLQPLIDELNTLLAVGDKLDEIEAVEAKLTELTAIYNKLSVLQALYDDLAEFNALYASLSELLAVHTNLGKITNVEAALASIAAVEAKLTELQAVYAKLAEIETVADNIVALAAIHTELAKLTELHSNLAKLTTVYNNLSAIGELADSIDNLNHLAASLTNLNTLAASLTNLNALAGSLDELNTLHSNLSALLTVEDNLTAINAVNAALTSIATAATNIAAIQTASANIDAIIAAPTHATTATNAAAAAVVTKGQVEDLKGDVQTLKSETNTLKLAAETAKVNAAESEVNAAASAAQAETLANSISLGGIFWPETEALRTRVIADEGTFIQPMRIIDPQMDDVQGVNTPLLTNMAAYKTGKLYSIRPDDGSGDFTCVRATTPTRINQLGESEVVPVNTPVIDWSAGSPLLIVTEYGELTLTTPASATKIVITIDGEDVEYNNMFPTLSLPVGSITKVIATVGGTEYNLLRDYLLRVSSDYGIITEAGATDVKDLFNQIEDSELEPSLAMTSGCAIKAGKIYSQIPSDGSGDFTVTRAGTTAFTRTSDGYWKPAAANEPRFTYTGGVRGLLVEGAATNLLPYYKSFARSEWVKSGATIDNNNGTGYTCPVLNSDGSNSMAGYKFVEDINNGFHEMYIGIVSVISNIYVFSVLAKKGERGWIQLIARNGQRCHFNLENGTLGYSDSADSIITDTIDGYYKCSITFTSLRTNERCYIRIAKEDKNFSYQGEAGKGIYISHANIVQASAPSSPIGGAEGATQTRNADAETVAVPAGVTQIILTDLNDVEMVVTSFSSPYQIPVGTWKSIIMK